MDPRESLLQSTTDKKDLRPDSECDLSHWVSGIRYGSVEITIHEGKVVQVERREKVRFEKKDHKKNQD